jgi:hypothetical protein
MGKEGTDAVLVHSEMILADNFATTSPLFVKVALSGDNLRKVLLINTPINNAQGSSVLFGLLLASKILHGRPFRSRVLQLDFAL